MRFRLTYEGILYASQNTSDKKKHKHCIRKSFHPQLKNMWENHPLLSVLKVAGTLEENFDMMSTPSDFFARLAPEKNQLRPLNRVISEYSCFWRDDYKFVPLVCKCFRLQCSFDILLLTGTRPGPPTGDLDNRVKTLVDALRALC